MIMQCEIDKTIQLRKTATCLLDIKPSPFSFSIKTNLKPLRIIAKSQTQPNMEAALKLFTFG